MSAIAGVIDFSGAPVPPALVERLNASMKSRGPEGQRQWCDGPAALGHCALNTTPESLHEQLPLSHHPTGITLTADARLDNRSELCRALQLADSAGDGDIILEAYLRWGETFTHRLRGDFAFAIWDPRHGELICARDPLGARSLYYHVSGDRLIFASLPEAIASLPEVSRELDDNFVASLLIPDLSLQLTDKTPYKQIKTLMPAHALTARAGSIPRIYKYWSLTPAPHARPGNLAESIEAFEELFETSLAEKLRSTRPASLLVSGGIDSGMLAAASDRLSSKPGHTDLSTYSTVADSDANCAESRAIHAFTGLPHFKANYLSVPSFKQLPDPGELAQVVWGSPHPVDSSLVLPALMARQATRDGHKVMLHAVSGDLIQWSDMSHIAQGIRRCALGYAWRESRLASCNHTYQSGSSPLTILLKSAYHDLVPLAVRSRIMAQRVRRYGLPPYLAPDFIEGHKLEQTLRDFVFDRFAKISAMSPFQRYCHALQLMVSGLTGFNRVGGHAGLEMRDPWADTRLASFFAALPLQFRVRGGWTKYLARASVAKRIDPAHCWRNDKYHLGFHFHRKAMADADSALGEWVHGDLGHASQYLSASEVQSLYSRHKQGDARASNSLYKLLVFILWLQRVYN